MNLSTKREQKAELLTIQQACEVTSLGKTKLRELASDAGAVRKIGRNYRVRLESWCVLFKTMERRTTFISMIFMKMRWRKNQ